MSSHTRPAMMNSLWMLILISLILSGCSSGGREMSGGTEVGNPTYASASTFSYKGQVESYLREELAANLTAEAPPAKGGGSSGVVKTGQLVAGSNFSAINIKHTDVDASDEVKTDGTTFYIAGNNTVSVFKANPREDMGKESTIAVSGAVDSLELYKNILIIVYRPADALSTWEMTAEEADYGMPSWFSSSAKTGILMMNVADPANPVKIKEIVTDSSLASLRLIGGKLQVVQQYIPKVPDLITVYDGTEEGRQRVIAANRKTLESYNFNDLTPSYVIVDANWRAAQRMPIVRADAYSRPAEPNGGNIMTITTVNLDESSLPLESIGFIADAYAVSISTEALYLISAAKKQKSSATVAENESCTEQTILYKFDLSGKSVGFSSTGKVCGQISLRFPLDEYDDVVRLATTSGFSSLTIGSVYCLKEMDNQLEIIGKLDNILPGEALSSGRFIGTRGFLFSTAQGGNLITLDLSDPAKPRKVGAINPSGYPNFIRPMGDTGLLTLGEDNGGEHNRVVLSVFDTSDLARPVLKYREMPGAPNGANGTQSEALSNGKALTFRSGDGGLLALPVVNQSPGPSASPGTSALYVYRVTTDAGFKFLGRIDAIPKNPDWTRGVFIDPNVYSVNGTAVRSASIDNIGATISTFELK